MGIKKGTNLNKNPINRICIKCNTIYSTTSSYSKYCKDCRKIRDLELGRKSYRKYKDKRLAYNKKYFELTGNKSHRNLNRTDYCVRCREMKIIDCRDMCHNCYEKWRVLNKKLALMSEDEKKAYLQKRGLLEKELSIDDFKKDLGVLKE